MSTRAMKIFDRRWRGSFVAVCLSAILLVAGFLLLVDLPSYNPYTFQEDFHGSLDPSIWETVGSGQSAIGSDGLTLQSKTSQSYALRRYLWTQPKWLAPPEPRLLGMVGLRFRFNGYLSGATAYVILETNSIRLGLSGSSVVFEDKRTAGSNAVADFDMGSWYSIEIVHSNDGVQLKLDDLAIWGSPGVFDLTWIAVGNLQPAAFGRNVGGSATVAELACLCHPAFMSSQVSLTTAGVTPKSVTAQGNAHIDTSQSKFGGASCSLLDEGDFLSTPDSDDLDFASGDFTIDFWARPNALPPIGSFQMYYSQLQDSSNRAYFSLCNNGAAYQWVFNVLASGNGTFSMERDTQISIGIWYHVALVRSDNTTYMFQDGSQLGTPGTINITTPNYAGPLEIAEEFDQFYPHSWIDEYRVSKGIARWTSNFTSPTSEYTNDAYTALLLHCNGKNGSRTIVDSSGLTPIAVTTSQMTTTATTSSIRTFTTTSETTYVSLPLAAKAVEKGALVLRRKIATAGETASLGLVDNICSPWINTRRM